MYQYSFTCYFPFCLFIIRCLMGSRIRPENFVRRFEVVFKEPCKVRNLVATLCIWWIFLYFSFFEETLRKCISTWSGYSNVHVLALCRYFFVFADLSNFQELKSVAHREKIFKKWVCKREKETWVKIYLWQSKQLEKVNSKSKIELTRKSFFLF